MLQHIVGNLTPSLPRHFKKSRILNGRDRDECLWISLMVVKALSISYLSSRWMHVYLCSDCCLNAIVNVMKSLTGQPSSIWINHKRKLWNTSLFPAAAAAAAYNKLGSSIRTQRPRKLPAGHSSLQLLAQGCSDKCPQWSVQLLRLTNLLSAGPIRWISCSWEVIRILATNFINCPVGQINLKPPETTHKYKLCE